MQESKIFEFLITYVRISKKEMNKVVISQECNDAANNCQEYCSYNKISGEIIANIRACGFPYKRYFLAEEKIKECFQNLRNYIPCFRCDIHYSVWNIKFKPFKGFNYVGKPLVLVSDDSNYYDYNIISDYFQEEARMRAKRADQQLSPYDFWCENVELVARKALKTYGCINAYTLRETLYTMIYECTLFRPTIMVTFIKKFKASHILDISAGWGDRLLGAMSQNVEYYFACDPNSILHENYAKMINMFAHDASKFEIRCEPYETTILPDKPFDLVLSSPPYFDLEEYSSEDTQSIFGRDLDTWLHEFLFASLEKSYNALVTGGHMVIVINDFKTIQLVEKMLIFMRKINAIYEGVISYASMIDDRYKSPQPMWIWRKK
jgi:16S rRNA G966 N2-methylase RsmD